MTAFANVKAFVFDAYGTLFDLQSSTVKILQPAIGGTSQRLLEIWRRKQLEYSWLRSLMGVHADFWQLTQDSLDYAFDACAIKDAGLRQKLLDTFLTLDAYPDAISTLQALRACGLKTAILSNGSPFMLEKAVASAGLGSLLDHVLSVESAGTYKPHAKIYDLAPAALSLTPGEIGFVSSNTWDVAGSAHYGFRTVHVARQKQPRERLPGEPAAIVSSLAEIPRLRDATS